MRLFQIQRNLKKLKENSTLPYLRKYAVSNLTDKHYNIRMKNNYDYRLYSIILVNEKDLRFTFHAIPTFRDNKSRPNKYNSKSNTYYTLQVQFLGVDEVVNIDNLIDNKLSKDDVKNIIKKCDVQFYSDDTSFYYQGFWEDLAKNHLSIYPFSGVKGKGVWRDIHSNSGGLANPEIRVTKHLEQLLLDFDSILLNQIDSFLKKEEIEMTNNSSKFMESFSEKELEFINSNEDKLRPVVNRLMGVKKSDVIFDFLNEKLSENKSILNQVHDLVYDNYEKYKNVFSELEAFNKANNITVNSSKEIKKLSELSLSDSAKSFLLKTFYIKGKEEVEKSRYDDSIQNKTHRGTYNLNEAMQLDGLGEVLFSLIISGYKLANHNKGHGGDLQGVTKKGEETKDLIEVKTTRSLLSGFKKLLDPSIDFKDCIKNTLERMSSININPLYSNLLNNRSFKIFIKDKEVSFTPYIKKTNTVDTYTKFIDMFKSVSPNNSTACNKFFIEYFKTIRDTTIIGKDVLNADRFDEALIKRILEKNNCSDIYTANIKNIIKSIRDFLNIIMLSVYIINEQSNKYNRHLLICKKSTSNVEFEIISFKDTEDLINYYLGSSCHIKIEPDYSKNSKGYRISPNF